MKLLFTIILASLFANTAFADKSDVVVTATDFSCSELQEIVEVHNVVYMKGLDSRNIYANSNDACATERPDDNYAFSFQTYWESNDSTACRVGFGCLTSRPQNDDLGDEDIPDTKK